MWYWLFSDELGSEKCKICSPNFYSDEKGSSYCKECEENKLLNLKNEKMYHKVKLINYLIFEKKWNFFLINLINL